MLHLFWTVYTRVPHNLSVTKRNVAALEVKLTKLEMCVCVSAWRGGPVYVRYRERREARVHYGGRVYACGPVRVTGEMSAID